MSAVAGPVLVKICGITSEADALLAVGLGADAIGFVFAPSTRQMAPRAVQRIAERVPAETLTVGVFRNESPERVADIVNRVGLHAAQLHGDEPAEECRWIAGRVPMLIKAFPAGHPGVADAAAYGASLILVDAASPGSGEVFDWRLAEGVADPGRLVVAGGLTAANVGDAIAHLSPRGVDVSSGVESAPGHKDPRLVQAFVAAVRAASGFPTGGWPEGGSWADAAAWAGSDERPAHGDPSRPGSGRAGVGRDEHGAEPLPAAADGPFDWEVGR